MKPTDLVTLREIADRVGVSPLTPRQWVQRYDTFPAPWRVGAHGEPHLYLWVDVESWVRQTGR